MEQDDADSLSSFSEDLKSSLNEITSNDEELTHPNRKKARNLQVTQLNHSPELITIGDKFTSIGLRGLLDEFSYVYRINGKDFKNPTYTCTNINCSATLRSISWNEFEVWLLCGTHLDDMCRDNVVIWKTIVAGSSIHFFPNVSNPSQILYDNHIYLLQENRLSRGMILQCKNCKIQIKMFKVNSGSEENIAIQKKCVRSLTEHFHPIPHTCKQLNPAELLQMTNSRPFEHIAQRTIKLQLRKGQKPRTIKEKREAYRPLKTKILKKNTISITIPKHEISKRGYQGLMHNWGTMKGKRRKIEVTVLKSPKLSNIGSSFCESNSSHNSEGLENSESNTVPRIQQEFLILLRKFYKLNNEPITKQLNKILPDLEKYSQAYSDPRIMSLSFIQSSSLPGHEYNFWSEDGNLCVRLGNGYWHFCEFPEGCNNLLEICRGDTLCSQHSELITYRVTHIRFRIPKFKNYIEKWVHHISTAASTLSKELCPRFNKICEDVSNSQNVPYATLRESIDKSMEILDEVHFSREEYDEYTKFYANLQVTVYLKCQLMAYSTGMYKKVVYGNKSLHFLHNADFGVLRNMIKKTNSEIYLMDEYEYVQMKIEEFMYRSPISEQVAKAKAQKYWRKHQKLCHIDFHNYSGYTKEIQTYLNDIRICYGQCNQHTSSHAIYQVDVFITSKPTGVIGRYIGLNTKWTLVNQMAICHTNIELDTTSLGEYLRSLRSQEIAYRLSVKTLAFTDPANCYKLEGLYQISQLLRQIFKQDWQIKFLNRGIKTIELFTPEFRQLQAIIMKEFNLWFSYITFEDGGKNSSNKDINPNAKSQNAENEQAPNADSLPPKKPAKSYRTGRNIYEMALQIERDFPESQINKQLFDLTTMETPAGMPKLDSSIIADYLEITLRNSDHIISKIDDLTLLNVEYKQLFYGDLFLPDQVIYAYLKLLKNETDLFINTYVFPPTLTVHLAEEISSARRNQGFAAFLNKLGPGLEEIIFNFDVLLFPIITHGQHSTLVAVWPKEKQIRLYDSLFLESSHIQLSNTYNFICSEYMRLMSAGFNCTIDGWGTPDFLSSWKLISMTKNEIPVQRNGFDCGVYVCASAYYILDKLDQVLINKFDQRHIQYFRLKIGMELYLKKLHDDI